MTLSAALMPPVAGPIASMKMRPVISRSAGDCRPSQPDSHAASAARPTTSYAPSGTEWRSCSRSMSCSSGAPKSLRHALALDAADVWTGSGGVLERVASDRDAGEGRLALMAAEESAVVRCSCVYGLVDD